MNGLILAAPNSGAGKTTITLGILHALHRRGVSVRGAKSGPDYIDPRFHEAACGGTPCPNLDAWAMTPARIRSLAIGDGMLVIEGAMGLFDGAPPHGKGASADLAKILNLPIILVVDAAKTAQSVAPLVAGFAAHDPDVRIAGIILNNVGSARHETMLIRALCALEIPVIGAVHRQGGLTHPSRHLGLMQAAEHPDLQAYLTRAADAIEAALDLDLLIDLSGTLPSSAPHLPFPPPAQTISVAQDQAFAFAYPHLLADWRKAGVQINFFSPLANDPAPKADIIILPGGYPELHGGRLANNSIFKTSMHTAAQNGTQIYGECGGYMVLGDAIIDKNGTGHEMLGLLPLETSFAKRKLHLGYRHLTAISGPFQGDFTGHEFHYTTATKQIGTPLFSATDAEGTTLPDMGLIAKNVCGSYAHIIDRAK